MIKMAFDIHTSSVATSMPFSTSQSRQVWSILPVAIKVLWGLNETHTWKTVNHSREISPIWKKPPPKRQENKQPKTYFYTWKKEKMIVHFHWMQWNPPFPPSSKILLTLIYIRLTSNMLLKSTDMTSSGCSSCLSVSLFHVFLVPCRCLDLVVIFSVCQWVFYSNVVFECLEDYIYIVN